MLSGDQESEVRYLAQQVGIQEVYSGVSPEEKLRIVSAESAQTNTMFVGDGINDAPALAAATIGIAFGQHSDITSEAARAVVLESSLSKIDELLHIGDRLRTIALQSSIGGISLSLIAMGFATVGLLPPITGAVVQELIDLAAIFNALRITFRKKTLSDASLHQAQAPLRSR